MELKTVAADAARALIAAGDLPTDDLDDPSIALIGAFDDGGALVGVVGLQSCGDEAALLRSLAVAPAYRSRGLGGRLCARVVELAGDRPLWLLTTTAQDYFVRHGFVAVARDEVPDAIRATAQFTSLCPSTAIVMRR
jgi:amino-acid N-acetyltransferase